MDAITIRAGPRALAAIREGGLRAADVAIVPGAAGGPKALGLHGLDVALFGEWFPKAPRVRHLIGASIGAWRFAAACRPDPVQGLRELARLYAGQRFPPRPAATLVSRKVREMLAELFDGHDADILGDPGYRLHILVVRGRGLLARDAGIRRTFGFGAAAVANLAGRRHLRHFPSAPSSTTRANGRPSSTRPRSPGTCCPRAAPRPSASTPSARTPWRSSATTCARPSWLPPRSRW